MLALAITALARMQNKGADDSMRSSAGDGSSSGPLASAPSMSEPTGGPEPEATEPVLSSQEDATPEDNPSMSEAVAEKVDIFADPITEAETEAKDVVKEKEDDNSNGSRLPETTGKPKKVLKPQKTQVFGAEEPSSRIKQLQKLLADAKKLRRAKTPSWKAQDSISRMPSSASLTSEKPVEVFDSLPFGGDTVDTQIAPDLCNAAAERFYNEDPPPADSDDSPDDVVIWQHDSCPSLFWLLTR
eukprot:s66_g45.t1